MATYSDSRIGFADWKSSGRSFAFVSAAAALLGGVALYVSYGGATWLAVDSSDRFVGSALGWIAVGVSAILVLAVVGSISIMRRAKDAVVVSEMGVLRQSPKGDLFLTRSEILGMAPMPGRRLIQGGVVLITADPNRRIVISASLAKYAACLDELRSMGITELSPLRRSRRQLLAVWLLRFCALWELLLVLDRHNAPIVAGHPVVVLVAGIVFFGALSWWAWRVESYPAEVSQP